MKFSRKSSNVVTIPFVSWAYKVKNSTFFMQADFLLGALAAFNIASLEVFDLNAYPVDLTPMPFVVDVKLTDNQVEAFMPKATINPFKIK